jgi:hypothetical protein
MSEIMIRCPESGSEISTGIACDGATFRFLPFLVSHAHCPICGKAHVWSKSDAWLSDAVPVLSSKECGHSEPGAGGRDCPQ